MIQTMRIKELREAADLIQQQLTDRMGVVRGAVTNWETENALPRTRQLPLLMHVLGVGSIDDLYVPEALVPPMDQYTA